MIEIFRRLKLIIHISRPKNCPKKDLIWLKRLKMTNIYGEFKSNKSPKGEIGGTQFILIFIFIFILILVFIFLFTSLFISIFSPVHLSHQNITCQSPRGQLCISHDITLSLIRYLQCHLSVPLMSSVRPPLVSPVRPPQMKHVFSP